MDSLAGQLDFAIPLSPLAPRTARAALVEGSVQIPSATMNVAELLVSELVSNSVRHSHLPPQAPIVLRVRAGAQRVYVEVEDAGCGFAEADAMDPGPDDGGWGLYVISYLADRWGVERAPTATRVWFELDLPREPDRL